MKTTMIAMTLFASAASAVMANQINKASDITYEFLVELGEKGGYLDYLRHMNKLLSHKKARTFLEFGAGYQTKYFLDSCRKVISVDFITPSYTPYTSEDGVMNCLNLYRDFSNWIPLIYFSGYQGDVNWAPYKYLGSDHLFRANGYQASTLQNYSKIDGFYLVELNAFLSNLLRYHKVDVALVNPRMYLRGDIVTLLFGKVPVIMAHDTTVRIPGKKDDIYGYSRIETPSDYEEIYLPIGSGTTVWISKKDDFKELIEELKIYAKQF